jgi:predicted metal-dependent hydrolase
MSLSELIDRIERSARRRSITLIVGHDGALIVRAPIHAPDSMILDAVTRNRSWVLRKKTEAKNARASLPVTPFVFYLGEKYPVTTVEGQDSPLLFDSGVKISAVYAERASVIVKSWLFQRAEETLIPRAAELAARFGLSLARVRVGDAGKRWGSCSGKKSVNLNWRLVMTPPKIADYIIIHELAHLRELNHSPAYWRIVASMDPDYGVSERWLRKNSPLLLSWELSGPVG